MVLFELSQVSVGYDRPVLHAIDCVIEQGEFIAIIGPNGAGKSTLLSTLAGEHSPWCGTLRYKNRPLTDYSIDQIAREFSVVHQFTEHLPPFTVLEFVLLGRFPYRRLLNSDNDEDVAIARQAMDALGIADLADRRIIDLSGGEMQLARVAHCLAQNEHILLLDEPISHLDITHAVRLMDRLAELNRRGSTIVIVLHDINIASDYCSTIIGLKQGNVFFSGKPADVLRYDSLESLFETPCVVLENPISGHPFVYPVPGYLRQGR
jgi:iron complex transport system ATP-binding protein